MDALDGAVVDLETGLLALAGLVEAGTFELHVGVFLPEGTAFARRLGVCATDLLLTLTSLEGLVPFCQFTRGLSALRKLLPEMERSPVLTASEGVFGLPTLGRRL